jgi:site-specific recombinase XerD
MAEIRVVRSVEGHRLVGDCAVVWVGNGFLEHLSVRRFSPATVRAYAFDVANFAGFLADRSLGLADVEPSDLFDYLGWQQARRPTTGKVTVLRRQGPSLAMLNRRIAAVRGLFEYLVMRGDRDDNPVPVARRSSGLRGQRGMLGHVAVRQRGGGRLVREPSRLPESVEAVDVAAFLADLQTHRDRAVVLVMVLGGLRAAVVRALRLADVDMGLRRVRVVGKGNEERVVPVDGVFFTECAACL